MNFKIGDINIGRNYPPVVIAEIGINHNGSIKTAKEMVDSACRAGVRIIKHQTHIVKDEMVPSAKEVKPGNSDLSIYEIMEKCSLSESDEIELKKYVELKGMVFISTPFSRAAADRLQKMNVQAFKIGSGECNNLPLLDHVASFKKPIILSTGMNDIESVKESVQILENHNVKFALLHTTNLYPTPENLVRLGAMDELANEFNEVPYGLSDHTTSNLACLAAVARGASIIERHFTDSMDRIGPDIICSMDEENTKDLINNSLRIFNMQGGKKEAAKEEDITINFAFSSIVTIAEIRKGESFSKKNLWVKRPGNGELKASKFFNVIGKKASRDIGSDVQLKIDDIIDYN